MSYYQFNRQEILGKANKRYSKVLKKKLLSIITKQRSHKRKVKKLIQKLAKRRKDKIKE